MVAPLVTGNIARRMLTLALPVLVEQSLTLLVGYTDWWLTGHYLAGAEYKAAMGLLAYALWLVPSLFAAAAIGATALVSRSVGQQDALGAARATKQALLLGCGLAAAVAIAGMLLGRPFIAAMQLRGEAAELAWRYLAIVVPFAPAIAAQQIVAASLRGAGDTVSGMLAQAAVNAVNMTLGPALVTGWWIFPELGWRGLAIGTAAGYAFAAAVLLARLFRRRSAIRMRLATSWRVEPETMKRLLRIGLPGGFDVLAIVSCHLAYLAIINRLGDLSAAAHGLGVQIEALGYLPGTAFQVAAATLVGQSLGAGQPDRAQRGALVALAAGASIMTLAGLTFFFAGHALADFFAKPGDQAAALAGQLLKVVAFSMPSLATTMILTGALRGAGDTRWPLVITLVSYLGVRLPGAAFLAWDEVPLPLIEIAIPGMGLGVFGAWYAMVADVVLRSILIAARFFHGGWKRVRV